MLGGGSFGSLPAEVGTQVETQGSRRPTRSPTMTRARSSGSGRPPRQSSPRSPAGPDGRAGDDERVMTAASMCARQAGHRCMPAKSTPSRAEVARRGRNRVIGQHDAFERPNVPTSRRRARRRPRHRCRSPAHAARRQDHNHVGQGVEQRLARGRAAGSRELLRRRCPKWLAEHRRSRCHGKVEPNELRHRPVA